MLNWLAEAIRSFWKLFVWWIVVLPWEQALLVRSLPFRTQRKRKLNPGLRFRVPYLDRVFKQTNRLRFTSLRPQTVTTTDGHTITMAGVMGYTIEDVGLLYDTLHQAEDALRSMAQSLIAKYVSTHTLTESGPALIEVSVEKESNLASYGLSMKSVALTTYARVRVYRLIMDNQESIYEGILNTIMDDDGKAPQ